MTSKVSQGQGYRWPNEKVGKGVAFSTGTTSRLPRSVSDVQGQSRSFVWLSLEGGP